MAKKRDRLEELLFRAGYTRSRAAELYSYLKTNGVVTVAALENCPPQVGTRLMGEDTYSLISAVVQADRQPEPPDEAEDLPADVKEQDNDDD